MHSHVGDDSSLSECTGDRIQQPRQSIDPPVENVALEPAPEESEQDTPAASEQQTPAESEQQTPVESEQQVPLASEHRISLEFLIPTHIHREEESVSDIMTWDGVSVQLRNELANTHQAEVDEEQKRVMSEFGLHDEDAQRPIIVSLDDVLADKEKLQSPQANPDSGIQKAMGTPETIQSPSAGDGDEEAGVTQKPTDNKGIPSTIAITGATLATDDETNDERSSLFRDGMICGVSVVRLIALLAVIMVIAIVGAVTASVVSAKNRASVAGGAASAQENDGPNASAPITVPPIYFVPKSPTPSPSLPPSQTAKTVSPGQPITTSPSRSQTSSPTQEQANTIPDSPSPEPTKDPTKEPTREPTREPTPKPTRKPTKRPTPSPAKAPTTPSPTAMPVETTPNPTNPRTTPNPTNPRTTATPTVDIGKNPADSPPTVAPTLLVTFTPSLSPATTPSISPSAYYTPELESPTNPPTPSDGLKGQILSFSPNSANALEDDTSPQSQALKWLESEDYSSLEPWSLMQKWALSVFAYSTGVGSWDRGTYSWVIDWDECGWHGVSCDWNGQVDSITLDQNSLEGTIPDEFVLLGDTLVTLDLRDNDISGSFPSAFGELTALKELHLEWNKLKGSLPTEIGEMQALEEIYIEWNYLDGEIPDEVGNLTNLNVISIYSNSFTGSLPSSVCDINYNELLLDCKEVSTKCYTTCYWQCDGDTNVPC